MGFVNAVRNIGIREIAKHPVSEFDDIDSFLEMPAEVVVNKGDSDKDKKKSKQPAKEIRVWLDVEDPQSEMLNVRGIAKIDIADFWNGSDGDRIKKRRYLYREPVGRAAKWRFSPIYKLGAGSADSAVALAGKDGNWRGNKQSRFYKLYDSTLRAFEKTGVFSPGGVDVIMESLSERITEISGYWSNKQSSYLLILSPFIGGRFLYPVEVNSYLRYFRSRLAAQTAAVRQPKEGEAPAVCALCNSSSDNVVNLDQVFAFATFDKKSFLPGNVDSDENKKKVFPLCSQCYKEMSEGRVRIDNAFTDAESLYGVRIYVVPELLVGAGKLEKASPLGRDFLQTGLSREPYISKNIMKMNDEVVLHFVFWEKNQAQERLLLMVEDVPPSRLKRAETAWMSSAEATGIAALFKEQSKSYPGSILCRAMGRMWSKVMELAGKSEGEQTYTRDWMLGIEGRILAGEHINVDAVKKFFVSRVQGLCADHDWVQKSSKYFARDIACIVDFLYRLNEKEESL